MKNERHEAILKLVADEVIQTQEDLISRLHDIGYNVTQATVSRDIRELKLTKVLSTRGVYRYIVPTGGDGKAVTRINESLMNAITKVDHAMNIVVISTYPGMAQAVAAGIDSEKSPEILGCVGGDDTIVVIARSEDAAVDVCENIKNMKSGKNS